MKPGDVYWLEFRRGSSVLHEAIGSFISTPVPFRGWITIVSIAKANPSGPYRSFTNDAGYVTFLYHGKLYEEPLGWVEGMCHETR